MRRLLPTALALFLAAVSLHAQETEALSFTRIDRNPVTSAFAGAGSASMGNVAWSAFSNASVLPLYDGTLDAAVSFQRWAPALSGGTHWNAGVAYKIAPRLGVSVGYALQRGVEREVLDENGLEAGLFRPSDQVFALGLAFGLGEKWALGLNGRYASQRLTESILSSGFSGDVSFSFQPSDAFRLSFGVSSLGPRVKSQTGTTYRQPASAQVAADWSLHFSEAFSLDLLADADYFFSGNYGVSVGTELAWSRTAFLRAGYRYATPGCVLPGHVALGAGVRFAGFRLDVSWLTASPSLGNTISAGLGFAF